MRTPVVLAVVLGAALSVFAGEYRGQPTCDSCAMLVLDEAFGGRLTTVQGKTFIFDASECMAAFSMRKVRRQDIRELRSVEHTPPHTLLDARSAWYLQSEKRLSPMGMNLSAYASRDEAERARLDVGGVVLTWDQVVLLIKRRWLKQKRH